jgi:hypothetical protein
MSERPPHDEVQIKKVDIPGGSSGRIEGELPEKFVTW